MAAGSPFSPDAKLRLRKMTTPIPTAKKKTRTSISFTSSLPPAAKLSRSPREKKRSTHFAGQPTRGHCTSRPAIHGPRNRKTTTKKNGRMFSSTAPPNAATPSSRSIWPQRWLNTPLRRPKNKKIRIRKKNRTSPRERTPLPHLRSASRIWSHHSTTASWPL